MRAVAILHIPDSPFGAVRLDYDDLARALAGGGDVLDVVTPERLPVAGRLHARWWVLVVPFSAAWWLWRRRRQYDVALFHSYAGWVFALLPDTVPAILEFHGLEPLFYAELAAEQRRHGRRLSLPLRAVYGWLMPRVLRFASRRSRLVTCLNEEERRYLVAHGWADPARLAVIRQTVRPEFFVDNRVFSSRATQVLVLSQWLETKGTADIVAAFSELARRHADVRLACYGTRAPREKVLEAFPPDVRGRVAVVPEIDPAGVAAAYREADILLHASVSEGSGRAVMQGMAAALPMVVTPTGLVPELLQDGRDCLVVPKRDSAAIVAALNRLLDDVELRRRLGTGARRAAELFRTDGRRHADLIRQVAREAHRRV